MSRSLKKQRREAGKMKITMVGSQREYEEEKAREAKIVEDIKRREKFYEKVIVKLGDVLNDKDVFEYDVCSYRDMRECVFLHRRKMLRSKFFNRYLGWLLARSWTTFCFIESIYVSCKKTENNTSDNMPDLPHTIMRIRFDDPGMFWPRHEEFKKLIMSLEKEMEEVGINEVKIDFK